MEFSPKHVDVHMLTLHMCSLQEALVVYSDTDLVMTSFLSNTDFLFIEAIIYYLCGFLWFLYLRYSRIPSCLVFQSVGTCLTHTL